ncbi:hypothetical protein [Paraburkholderia kururiensis]|uniref:hypothetical protein n=1 Tax=Paraburkholderia kururiensis TaxID=984307 RepID=UPI0018F3B500|nr:hypothetical protein [Paraburkholderia kururiensis]
MDFAFLFRAICVACALRGYVLRAVDGQFADYRAALSPQVAISGLLLRAQWGLDEITCTLLTVKD